jgi:hypothetical protein
MPVVRHQNIAAEQKSQPSPGTLQYTEEQIEFSFVEAPEPRTKIHAEKKDNVGVAQAMDVGHARSLAPRPLAFKEEPTVRKSQRRYLLAYGSPPVKLPQTRSMTRF